MRSLIITSFFVLLIPSVHAVEDSLDTLTPEATRTTQESRRGSLASVIDSFLNAYAADNPAWRTNIRTDSVDENSAIPPGYQKAQSALGVWFIYMPKTHDLLNVEERRSVMRDKRFAPFLAQLRSLSDGTTAPLSPALVEAAKKPEAQTKPRVEGRAELVARLLAGRRPPPDPIALEISPTEMLMPGPFLLIQPLNKP